MNEYQRREDVASKVRWTLRRFGFWVESVPWARAGWYDDGYADVAAIIYRSEREYDQIAAALTDPRQTTLRVTKETKTRVFIAARISEVK